MTKGKPGESRLRKFGYVSFLLVMLLFVVPLAISADDRGAEVIDAIAMGTSTQLGTIVK